MNDVGQAEVSDETMPFVEAKRSERVWIVILTVVGSIGIDFYFLKALGARMVAFSGR